MQLIEEDRTTTKAQNEWLAKLKQYRDQLASANPREARAAILQMNDPHAVKALAKALESEANENIRHLYLERAGQRGDRARGEDSGRLVSAGAPGGTADGLPDPLKGNRQAVDFLPACSAAPTTAM